MVLLTAPPLAHRPEPGKISRSHFGTAGADPRKKTAHPERPCRTRQRHGEQTGYLDTRQLLSCRTVSFDYIILQEQEDILDICTAEEATR